MIRVNDLEMGTLPRVISWGKCYHNGWFLSWKAFQATGGRGSWEAGLEGTILPEWGVEGRGQEPRHAVVSLSEKRQGNTFFLELPADTLILAP